MKLFFCDICNESIPLQDIKENRSTTIKGKIFCRKCNPLNELGGADAPAGSGGGASRGLLALVAVLLVGVLGALGWLIVERRNAPGEAAANPGGARLAQLETRVADLRTVTTALQRAAEDMGNLEALDDRVKALQEDAAGRDALAARLTGDVAELQDGLVAVGKLRERVEGLSLRQEESNQQVDGVLSALDEVRSQLADLAARPPVVIAADGAGAPAVAEGDTAGDGAVEALSEDLLGIVEKLAAEDPMARWEAVDLIRRRREKALIPHVLPLLDDRDTFVRAQAIYTLGELKAMTAVPKLVKLLRDDEIMIREEALTSLVVITGQNLKFDVTGSRSTREAGIRKWEDWLARNQEKF